jgi:transcriptional regulator GlxA family with amidase domain
MSNRPRVIAFLVASPFELLDLAGPASVFSYPRVDGNPHYILKILSTDNYQGVQSSAGLTISNSGHFSKYHGPIDTLIAVGGEGSLKKQAHDVIRWIRRRSLYARRVASVCTGAFLLASTGLLDGRHVTTHWRHLDLLAERHKHLLIERDPIFIKDGKFYTTAGVSAGIDLALFLVEEDLGHSVASSIARDMVLFVRRPGNQAQFSTLLANQAEVHGTPLRDLPSWVRTRLGQKLDVNTLSKAVAMTPRTFARQFELHFRTTPARWVQSLRVEAARQQIEARYLPVKAIARSIGFRDEQSMRRAFLQQLAMTPKQYRDRFGVEASKALTKTSELDDREN